VITGSVGFTALEVKIDSVDDTLMSYRTFSGSWGSWSTPATITREMVFSGFTLYFRVTSGFTLDDTWGWRAVTQFPVAISPATAESYCHFVEGEKVYFTHGGNVWEYDGLRVQQIGADGLVWGRYIEQFFGLLFVTGGEFEELQVKNSDLGDYDRFGAEFANEADLFRFVPGGVALQGSLNITGMKK